MLEREGREEREHKEREEREEREAVLAEEAEEERRKRGALPDLRKTRSSGSYKEDEMINQQTDAREQEEKLKKAADVRAAKAEEDLLALLEAEMIEAQTDLKTRITDAGGGQGTTTGDLYSGMGSTMGSASAVPGRSSSVTFDLGAPGSEAGGAGSDADSPTANIMKSLRQSIRAPKEDRETGIMHDKDRVGIRRSGTFGKMAQMAYQSGNFAFEVDDFVIGGADAYVNKLMVKSMGPGIMDQTGTSKAVGFLGDKPGIRGAALLGITPKKFEKTMGLAGSMEASPPTTMEEFKPPIGMDDGGRVLDGDERATQQQQAALDGESPIVLQSLGAHGGPRGEQIDESRFNEDGSPRRTVSELKSLLQSSAKKVKTMAAIRMAFNPFATDELFGSEALRLKKEKERLRAAGFTEADLDDMVIRDGNGPIAGDYSKPEIASDHIQELFPTSTHVSSCHGAQFHTHSTSEQGV